jgi:molybdenum cofactor biosynthesis enzyme MoaA
MRVTFLCAPVVLLNFSDILIIFHQLLQFNVKKINFAGGEPFLPIYQKLLGEMVKSAKEMGFE